MKTRLILGVYMALGTCTVKAQKVNVPKAFVDAAKQTEVLLREIKEDTAALRKKQVSPRTVENGKLVMVKSSDWTSGFFAGELWYFYEYTKDPKWMELARVYTEKIKKEQFNTGTHDLGFMVYCSFGNGYRLTGDTAYRSVIIQAARSLSKRFNPVAGVIKSWDHQKAKWKYPVIIDNMMNLELLFEATKLTGDSTFYKIAVSHADQTLRNHFRPDYSSWHVLDYDTLTGKVTQKLTAQGYSNESAWARGQAWALYGFTMCYRETHNETYLNQAKAIAKFILNNKSTPVDGIPYWDYNDPKIPNVSRDASAASITAAALYELDNYVPNGGYKKSADHLLYNLNKFYTNKVGSNKGFILEHSTGHRPANSEVDVPINYADYYYLEALLRLKNK
ncbi:MAG: glycoside hydrolase family 88 protein [Candidatus Pedobacter colombiensis]|uniref:Glycoside hydrolase family 88 protein n=1 Tax=Candidatus Pedobacter colombiensis TaxID=3121371 RepID=A0AAJ5W9G5_9SPHI|nr:glycoside hydrolase family 88 protein [Pedobacter sp.]WEK20120.1 MAG: glycoside hydrolase family 88 protein [Pedobacter sp.]